MLSALSGYDENILKGVDSTGQTILKLANLWALLGIIACAVSLALLIFQCGGGGALAISAAITILLLMTALQTYGVGTIAVSGIECNAIESNSFRSYTRSALALVMVLICLVFTQPYVMTWALVSGNFSGTNPSDISSQIGESSRKNQVDLVMRDIAAIQHQLGSIGNALSLPASVDTITSADRIMQNLNAARRKALVIGNNTYSVLRILEGAVPDAEQMRKTLISLGFEVTLLTNVDRQAMELGIEDYIQALRPGDISLFHFSGHGFQNRGTNYLIPIDFSADTERIAPPATALDILVESISRRKPLVSIISLDACRENFSGSAKAGLAALEAGANTYIAFAAGPGKVANEYTSRGGPARGLFTEALVRHLPKGIEVDEIFRLVRIDVAAASKKINPLEVQETWTQHNLTAPIVLSPNIGQKDLVERKLLASGGKPVASSSKSLEERYPPLMLSSGATICRLNPINSEDIAFDIYNRCLNSTLIRLRDDLKDLDRVKSSLPIVNSSAIPNTYNPHKALLAFRTQWAEPALPLLVTVVLLFLMSGGFILRSRLRDLHERYELALRDANRTFVREFAGRAWTRATRFPFSPDHELLRSRILGRFGEESSAEPMLGEHQTLFDFLQKQVTPSGSTT